jgi:hypothetical protein
MHYYGQPFEYFTDTISEAQFDLLFKRWAEVTSGGKYEIEEYPDEVNQEEFKRLYGNNQVVSK